MKRLSRMLINYGKRKNVETEMRELMINLHYHRFKFYGSFTFLTFPLYKDFALQRFQDLKTLLVEFINKQKDSESSKAPQIPLEKILANFGQTVSQNALYDTTVRYEAMELITGIISDRKVLMSSVNLLMKALNDPLFLEKVQLRGYGLGFDIVQDHKIQNSAYYLISGAFQEDMVLAEIGILFGRAFEQYDVSNVLGNQFSSAIASDHVMNELRAFFQEAAGDVANRPEMIENLKTVAYNLMSSEIAAQTRDGKQEGMITELLIQKKLRKEEEALRILRGSKKEGDQKKKGKRRSRRADQRKRQAAPPDRSNVVLKSGIQRDESYKRIEKILEAEKKIQEDSDYRRYLFDFNYQICRTDTFDKFDVIEGRIEKGDDLGFDLADLEEPIVDSVMIDQKGDDFEGEFLIQGMELHRRQTEVVKKASSSRSRRRELVDQRGVPLPEVDFESVLESRLDIRSHPYEEIPTRGYIRVGSVSVDGWSF